MNKRSIVLLTTFVGISTLVFFLGLYLISAKTSLRPQFFISTCGYILKNIREHVHFNPEAMLSSLILFTTVLGIGLALIQALRFIMSHRRLKSKHKNFGHLPQNLDWLIRKHNLQKIDITIVYESKLTAYATGLIKPRIVISQSLIKKVTRPQLEAIILHEFYHARNRHILWLFLTRLVSSLLFFVPFIEYLARQLKIEFELAADSFVVRKQKTHDHICGSLALNLQYSDKLIPHLATSPIEKRVESLLSRKVSFEKVSCWRFIISLTSLCFMIGLAFINPSQIAASFNTEADAVCHIQEGCKTPDCFETVSHKHSL